MKKLVYIIGIIGIFIVLRQPAAAATIAGTVTTPDSGALPSTMVGLYSGDDDPVVDPSQTTAAAANGTYSFTTASGSWYVIAMPDPTSNYAYNVVTDVTTVDSDDAVTVNIVLAATQVRGILYRPDEATPLEDWIVEAHTGDGSVYQGMVTNSSGQWNIGGLTVGRDYGIETRMATAESPNYDPPQGVNFTLAEGDAIREYELVTLSAPKEVNVTVQYPNGDAVSGANVGIYPVGGLIRHASSCYTVLDGTCSETVSGGDWLVDVNPDYSGQDNVDWAYFNPAEKVTFALDESEESIDIIFTVAKTNASVTGKVLNIDGSVPQGADVHVVNKDGEGIWGKVDYGTGEFTFPVIAGILKVRVFPMNSTDDAFGTEEIVVLPDEDYDIGTITGLIYDATISGSVVDADGNPVTAALVMAWDFTNDYHQTTNTDNDGKFTFNTYASTWTLTLPATDQYETTNSLTIEVGKNKTSSGNNITVKLRTQNIGGSLVNTTGAAVEADNFIPYAVDSDNRTYTGELQSGTTYSLNVPANDSYKVYLFFDQDSQYFIKDNLTAKVEQADVAGKDFILLETTGQVSGVLQNEDGNTVKNLEARVIASNHFGTRTTEVNTDNGSYSLELSPGDWQMTYELLEDSNQYMSRGEESLSVELEKNEEEAASFILTSTPNTVSGQVMERDGDPLPYVEVYLSNHDTKTTDEPVRQFFATADDDGKFELHVPDGNYELGAGNHPQTNNIAPAAVVVDVNKDVTKQELVFEKATATISGTVDQAEGFVRAYSDTGHFYSGYIRDGEYELDVIDDETVTVEAVSLAGEKLFRNIPQTVAVDGDSERGLQTWWDPAVAVPSSKAMSFQADEPQIFALGGDVQVELPSYSLGNDSSGEVTLIAEPSLEVQSFEYGLPINLSYDFSAKDTSGDIVTKLNQPVFLQMSWDEQELEALGIEEKAVFVTDHFSKFTLASSQQIKYSVAQVTDVNVSKKRTSSLTLNWQGVFAAKKYKVRYRPASTNKWKKVTANKTRKQLKSKYSLCNSSASAARR